jgi:uncharacterized membrane protein YhiD involved in acid resistance
MAFLNGPMTWDASRISAAIPSGVGFLGAGLIFKKDMASEDGESHPIVHGLTTAASVWLSAAVGIACGGELYMPASFGTASMMLLLRFGPRGDEEWEGEEDDDEDETDLVGEMAPMKRRSSSGGIPSEIVGSAHQEYQSISSDQKALLDFANSVRSKEKAKNMRKRPSLATMV